MSLFLKKKIEVPFISFPSIEQGVSGGTVNILRGGGMDYSE